MCEETAINQLVNNGRHYCAGEIHSMDPLPSSPAFSHHPVAPSSCLFTHHILCVHHGHRHLPMSTVV